MTQNARPPSARWYVVQTQPSSEAKAVAHLQRQGFEIYCPRYRKTRRHARRVETVAAPLFPRYLFVRIDISQQRWLAINSTCGVSNIVGHGITPTPVMSGVVEELRQCENADGLFELESPVMRLKAGDNVRVLNGAFDACQGLFEARSDSERVTILLDLLGRKVRVMLDAEQVEAA